MRAKCWRARISVGAIRAACAPASTIDAAASSATTVLPEPTSPCSSRSMRRGEAMSARISSSALLCPPVNRKGRAASIFAESAPVGTWAMPSRTTCRSRTSARASWLASSSS